jgi:anthraniloyl-CoA monooxygenase
MHGVPLSDRIRNEARVPTLALGGVIDPDQANAILMAGRADLVVLEPAPEADATSSGREAA